VNIFKVWDGLIGHH